MSRYRRVNATSGSYFFTVVSYRRQKILCDASIRTALHEAINKIRQRSPFTVDAWVLLPDHMHCIWTFPEGAADFSTCWRNIKRYVSLACGADYARREWLSDSKVKHRESTLWQRRFWERAIQWPYSTLHRYVKEGRCDVDWVVKDEEFEAVE